MDDLIGKPWGSMEKSHNGNTFFVLQLLYPILIKNVPEILRFCIKGYRISDFEPCNWNRKRVIEAGTGSGH
jgi:tRNA A58 N-methylase Trm61